MKKKILSLTLILILLFTVAMPVYAAETAETATKCNYVNYISKTIPQNVHAAYKHKGAYSYLEDHLQIAFDEVDYATSYDILIGKDSSFKECKIYSATTNYALISQDAFLTSCPNGYVVRVRARYGKVIRGMWSKPDTVGCNKLHI